MVTYNKEMICGERKIASSLRDFRVIEGSTGFA